MVNNMLRNQINETEKIIELPKDDVKWASISLSEVIEKGKRIEAPVFNVEAKHIREVLDQSKYPLIEIYSENGDGLIDESFYPGRFKRVYTDDKNGIPFYLPSQMTDIYPKPGKWISPKTNVSIEDLKVKYGTLLLTRSGTIGDAIIVTKTLENKVFSDDVIRTYFKNEIDLGYTYAYLKSDYGKKILQTNKYGSVVTHIEPEHLMEIPIPNPPIQLKSEISNKIQESFRLRDESNEVIDRASEELIDYLELPSFNELEDKTFKYSKDLNSFPVKLSDLKSRLDASYHLPIVEKLEKYLEKKSEMISLADSRLTKSIIQPGRFARTYVGKDYGIPFIGGKDLFRLESNTEKYLSKEVHKDRLEKELLIKPNSIVIPSRGTLGNLMLSMPQQIEKVAISDNLFQIEMLEDFVGYVYAFLNTQYGKTLIYRQRYGSVVKAIETVQLHDIKIPLIENKKKIKELNDMVLYANKCRFKAYELEKEAIALLDKKVIGIK